MALVLVHNAVVANPAHQWDDVEGVHYHYPSKYRGKIVTGAPFVYYRGVHRPGGKRGPAEYFGAGRIGEIWPDPDRPGAWYCAIDDYQKFAVPVPAKVDGQNREIIVANLWRDGVRRLDPQVYAGILADAGWTPAAAARSARDKDPALDAAPAAAPIAAAIAAAAVETAELIVPPRRAGPGRPGAAGGGERRSRQAKAVGDWAEAVALTYLQALANGAACVHRRDRRDPRMGHRLCRRRRPPAAGRGQGDRGGGLHGGGADRQRVGRGPRPRRRLLALSGGRLPHRPAQAAAAAEPGRPARRRRLERAPECHGRGFRADDRPSKGDEV